jgi:glycerol kinase
MKCILSIDQGTTSSRAILFDQKAQILAIKQQEFSQIYPQPGWVEHDANEILTSQFKVIRDLMEGVDFQKISIEAIGITNQRETIVAWSKKTGKPFHNAIVWQDTRTTKECNTLIEKGYSELFKSKTGLVIDSYFSATKMKWLMDNCEEVKKGFAQNDLLFGTIDSWLIWNLTKGKSHVTDVSNASRTLLFNIQTNEWDIELLEILGIPINTLPKVLDSSADFGIAEFDEFNLKIPIKAVLGDQQSALFGQCCFDKGEAKNTYGTGCFMLMNVGKELVHSKNGLITTIGWRIQGQTTYALEGSVFVAGAAVQWLRDGMKFIEMAADSEDLAKLSNPNNDVVFVPAFAGLGAPYWDMNARGAIFGLTRDTSIADIVRATLESLAFQTKDVLQAMQLDSQTPLVKLKVDGGASNNNFLMQFQANILNCSLERPVMTESTALGVCFMAGLGIELWKWDDLPKLRNVAATFEPQFDAKQIKVRYDKWLKAIEKTKNWLD